MTSQPKKMNHRISYLVWRRPIALWLVPLIYLFIVTPLPLLPSRGFGLFFGVSSFSFVLYGMSFVIAHHFFSFIHLLKRCDYYFALPVSRSRLFLSLNLGAFTYLLGPTLAIMGLNTVIGLIIAPSATGQLALWGELLGFLPQIIYFFLLLEVSYLLTGKSSTAINMFILINVFWPLMIFLYSDATSRFLPGFINPLEQAAHSTGVFILLQIFSPMSTALSDPIKYFWVTLLMAALLFVVAHWLFKHRQAGVTRGDSPTNGPFRLTEWMGIMAISLLGGYAAHLLRIQSAVNDKPLLSVSPAPFLIGLGLGFLLSLWLFNIIRGKGRILWRAFILPALTTAVPLIIWLLIIMTGAFGFTSKTPEDASVEKISIRYSNTYGSFLTTAENKPFIFELDDEKDTALMFNLYQTTVAPDNPGLSFPRTLESLEQLKDYLGNRYAATDDDGLGTYRIWYEDTYITLFFSDGTTKERILPIPMIFTNDDYRELLRQNRQFYMAELAASASMSTVYTLVDLETTPLLTEKDQAKWMEPLMELKAYDDQYYDSILRNLMSHAASVYAVADDKLYLEAMKTAPMRIKVSLDLPKEVDDPQEDFELTIPLDPNRDIRLAKIVEEALNVLEDRPLKER